MQQETVLRLIPYTLLENAHSAGSSFKTDTCESLSWYRNVPENSQTKDEIWNLYPGTLQKLLECVTRKM